MFHTAYFKVTHILKVNFLNIIVLAFISGMFPYCQIEGGRMMETEDGGGRGDEEVNDTREGGEKKEKILFIYF